MFFNKSGVLKYIACRASLVSFVSTWTHRVLVANPHGRGLRALYEYRLWVLIAFLAPTCQGYLPLQIPRLSSEISHHLGLFLCVLFYVLLSKRHLLQIIGNLKYLDIYGLYFPSPLGILLIVSVVGSILHITATVNFLINLQLEFSEVLVILNHSVIYRISS